MVPVAYTPGTFGAPPPGRNIFAFYEPPRPCPECPPDPTPTPKPYIPTPTPPLPFELQAINPQSVYMGSKAFRIEVAGDRFTPDAKIIFNNAELPTAFGGPQRLTASVPAELIAHQGSPSVTVRTPDGKGYSLSTTFLVQAPPKPQFKYVGMIARRLGNNDTAYFEEQGRQTRTGYRLNDVVSGRFRLVNISADRVVLEDVNLGFRHPVELFRPPPGTATTTGPGRTNLPPGMMPPGFPQRNSPQAMPGIPDNIPRYVPPRRNNTNSNSNRPDPDDDDDDDEPQRR